MSQFRCVLHKGKQACLHLFSIAVSAVFPVDSEKAVFSSFLGKSYSDNPRAVSEELHRMDPQMKIVWGFADPKVKRSVVPDYVKCVKINSLAMHFHRLTAGFWIDNYTKPLQTYKRPGQYYIQTWHGDRGLKKVLADMYEDPENCKLFESEHCDLAVSGSEFGEKVYHSSFRYNGDILKLGCPRNDILVNGDEEAVRAFRRLYNVADGVKLLLYAPTFRDANKSNTQKLTDLNMREVLIALERKTGTKWRLMVRGHTGRRLQIQGVQPADVIDATDYEDAKHVLLAADAVISDYSTVSTDFALLGRPVFLYVNDIDEYKNNSRALWFAMEETPFWYASDQKALLDLIEQYTPEAAMENCKAILDFYGTYETGKSTEAICEYIINKCKQDCAGMARRHRI